MDGEPRSARKKGHLPRLSSAHYRGTAVVFWTHTIADRATGWLDAIRHAEFREVLFHTAIREQVLCPIYTMMPDHIHVVWMGVATSSDQRRAATFVRSQFKRHLLPHQFQEQPHDHVLRDEERKRNAFAATCAYVAQNPLRKNLVRDAAAWTFTGCIVPGYPELNPLNERFWPIFWRVYNAAVTRGSLGKIDA